MARKRVLIDTSILIDHLRKSQKDQTIFFQLAKRYDCVVSVITEFEFSVGATSKSEEFTEKLFQHLHILSFDSTCTQTAIKLFRSLKSQNKLIPLPDIFIAATALTYDLPLQTLNRKHFERIQNLQLDVQIS